MNYVHVYSARSQPMTKYVDRNCKRPITVTHGEREVFMCSMCDRRRWAKNLMIQVYYDMSVIACREGHRWDGRRRRWVTLPEGSDNE